MRFYRIIDVQSVWINQYDNSFCTSRSHKTQFGRNIEDGDVGVIVFPRLVGGAPLLMKVKRIKEFDGTVECRGYQADVSDICNARDFGSFLLLLDGLPLFVLGFIASALLTLFILQNFLHVGCSWGLFSCCVGGHHVLVSME